MKEHEIRPRSLLERYIQISIEDIDNFFDTARFSEIDCPACAENTPREAFTKNGFPYVECTSCGSLYASPRPSENELTGYYKESASSKFWADEFHPTTAEARREKIFRPRAEQIVKRCGDDGIEPQVLIDVGSGYGIFAEEMAQAMPGVEVRGIEPGASLAEISRGRDVPVLQCTVEEASEWAGTADLATSFEVIEHVHNPETFLGAIRRLLRPGGMALVSGLGIDGFDTQVLWDRSKSIQPPHHLNFMSLDGFHRLFERVGFREVTITTPGRLDVDIVLNALAEKPDLELDRFSRLLLERRGAEVHAKFQEFLAWAGLSSHVWVWGRL
jgi:2-polyprenyl-3-methyl-5-hydroxy-6-metoxy-1,4-benzoquinol methylase